MSKTALMIEAPAEDKDEVIDIIMQNALSGNSGKSVSGKWSDYGTGRGSDCAVCGNSACI